MSIPYTICFCIQGDKVLLLYRNNPPNQHLWNGVGGKIEQNEDAKTAIKREIVEEAEIHVTEDWLSYVGIVTWQVVEDKENHNKGMYAFIARLPENTIFWNDMDTREGLLSWKPLSWALDTSNREIVDNIAHFLPVMLKTKSPKMYVCEYKDKKFKKLKIEELSS